MSERSKYSLQISQKAKRDLHNIHAYIEQELHEPETADHVLDRIIASIDSLAHMPRRNAVLEDMGLIQRRIRREIADNHLIFYTIIEEDKSVQIIRVLCNRRDWLHLL